jgi:hypothetical protein
LSKISKINKESFKSPKATGHGESSESLEELRLRVEKQFEANESRLNGLYGAIGTMEKRLTGLDDTIEDN